MLGKRKLNDSTNENKKNEKERKKEDPNQEKINNLMHSIICYLFPKTRN